MIDPISLRKSVRSYKTDLIPDKIIEEVLNAGISSPSAHHRYPWEFILIKNDETKEKLAKATPWSSFIADAAFVVAVVGDPSSEQWIEDLSIASQNMVIQAFSEGIGSCYVQIYTIDHEPEENLNSEQYVKKILEIQESNYEELKCQKIIQM